MEMINVNCKVLGFVFILFFFNLRDVVLEYRISVDKFSYIENVRNMLFIGVLLLGCCVKQRDRSRNVCTKASCLREEKIEKIIKVAKPDPSNRKRKILQRIFFVTKPKLTFIRACQLDFQAHYNYYNSRPIRIGHENVIHTFLLFDELTQHLF